LQFTEVDEIWVIATVGRRRNSYALRVREPKALGPNQFAYKLRIPFDREEWKSRITEVELAVVKPPRLPKPEITEKVEKDTPQKILDTLAGKD